MGRRTRTLLLVVTCPDGTEISGILRFGPTIAKSDHFNEAIRFPLEMFKEMARQPGGPAPPKPADWVGYG